MQFNAETVEIHQFGVLKNLQAAIESLHDFEEVDRFLSRFRSLNTVKVNDLFISAKKIQ